MRDACSRAAWYHTKDSFTKEEERLYFGTGALILQNGKQGLDRFIRFVVNVRFFNIEGTQDHVIDTLGMSLLWLEDQQYHFHGMDPNWVVNHAYNMASYRLGSDRPSVSFTFSSIVLDEFSICKAEEGNDAVASSADCNAADSIRFYHAEMQ